MLKKLLNLIYHKKFFNWLPTLLYCLYYVLTFKLVQAVYLPKISVPSSDKWCVLSWLQINYFKMHWILFFAIFMKVLYLCETCIFADFIIKFSSFTLWHLYDDTLRLCEREHCLLPSLPARKGKIHHFQFFIYVILNKKNFKSYMKILIALFFCLNQ